jgi:membrane protein DedA with SNARE-associated domain
VIDTFIEHFTYLGLFLTLVAAGLGAPIPEEAAIMAVDTAACLVGVPLGFGIAYLFTDRMRDLVAGVRHVERWIALALLVAIGVWVVVAAWRRGRRLE